MPRMSGVVKPTWREDEGGEPEASAVPESVRSVHDEGHAADPTFGDELQTFRPRRESTGSIDLACVADEPEQAIRMLIAAAREWINASENTEKWQAVVAQLAVLQKQLERLNEPSSHRGVKPSSP